MAHVLTSLRDRRLTPALFAIEYESKGSKALALA